MLLGLLFMIERVVTVWRSTLFAKFIAALLIPELIFATFLNIVFLKGVVDILLSRQAKWGEQDADPDAAQHTVAVSEQEEKP